MAESVGRGRLRRHNAKKRLQRLNAAQIVHTNESVQTSLVLHETVKHDGYLEGLIHAVSKLDITNHNRLHDIKSKLMDYSITLPLMQKCIRRFHENAIADAGFGRRAAAALATVSNLVIDNTKLRNILIKALQSYYTASAYVRRQNKFIFTNMVAYMGQVFSHFKVNNEPIQILSGPHLVYLERLLDGDMFELELYVLLLAQNGRKLAECQPTKSLLTADLFATMASRLLSNLIDSNTRAWLLLALHLNWNSFTLSELYFKVFTATLGVKNMARVKVALTLGALKLPLEALDQHGLQALMHGELEEEDCTEEVSPSSSMRPAGRGFARRTRSLASGPNNW